MSINDINISAINNKFDSINDLNPSNINSNINIINSIDNLSINDSKNSNQNKKENDKYYNKDSLNSNLISSKSTEYSSINNLENNNIFDYIYEDNNKIKIKNSIIILKEEQQNKNIYKTIINNFYCNNFNFNNKNLNKICFLILDSKKLEKLSEELKLIFKDKKISILKGGKGKKMKSDYDIFINNYFEKADIFVAIPDVFYKLLSTGFIKIYQFSILFLDDCHLCEGNHPYNTIMQEFYFYYLYRKYIIKIISNYSLPNIIGFSNSPFLYEKIINNDDKAKNYLINISENLDSQIICDYNLVSKDKEVNSYENKEDIEYIEISNYLCKEKIDIIYKILNHYFIEKALKLSLDDYSSNNNKNYLNDEIKNNIYKKYLDIINKKFYYKDKEEYKNIEALQNQFNFLSKGSYVFNIFEDILKYLLFVFKNLELDDFINIFEKYLNLFKNFLISQKKNQEYSMKILEKIQYLALIIKDCIGAFQHLKKNFDYQNEGTMQFLSLIESIYSNNKNSKVIIFTQSRKLSFLLNELLIRQGFKSGYLIGINTKREEILNLSLLTKTNYNIIEETNKKYNLGEINILICTSSICDNLKIDKCDYAIIFQELSNLNYDYIKIKKLAMNKLAKLIIFSSNIDNIKNILKEETKKLDNKSLFLDNKIIVKDYKRNNFIKEKFKIIEKNNYYFIEETHAKVSIKNSIILFNDINNWFISQNKKIIVNKFMDEYSIDKIKKYKFKIQLDQTFEDMKKDRILFSHSFGDKQSAEGDGYLQLIVFFHKYGIIDNHLKIIDSH